MDGENDNDFGIFDEKGLVTRGNKDAIMDIWGHIAEGNTDEIVHKIGVTVGDLTLAEIISTISN